MSTTSTMLMITSIVSIGNQGVTAGQGGMEKTALSVRARPVQPGMTMQKQPTPPITRWSAQTVASAIEKRADASA